MIGGRKLWMLYLCGALVSSMSHIGAEMMQRRGVWGISPAIGASGAVNALAVFACLLQPTATVYVYGIVPMPFWMVGLVWLYIDISGLSKDSGIAYAAHLGGAMVGALAYALFRMRGGRF
eukprot:TRINITY_DN16366_c1_g1_i1.p7 TRINITY_DN16366_c1_g1~~TRINITY_DN16366_c1_g1_i1.p7  ORF type:complete len:120 (+),score=18.21 TRINITY_DN16366_c1_g1_i1:487-846(+)